jgi:hypothetical protein
VFIRPRSSLDLHYRGVGLLDPFMKLIQWHCWPSRRK